MRQSADPASAHVILDIKPDGGIEFMTRPSAGASTTFVTGGALPPQSWIKLTRLGMTITGSVSLDGLTWTAVGSVTLPPTPVYVGLVVTSHDDTATAEGVFSQVSIAATTLPSPWSAIDIGDVGAAGSATFSDGTFTIQGAGADIWGMVDAFQFVYQVEPNFAASEERVLHTPGSSSSPPLPH
jgi:hypothetical protein